MVLITDENEPMGFADENDFDTTPKPVIFPSDEERTERTDVFIPIPMVDDAVNEADQTFIVQLEVVNTFKHLKISRSHSYCLILDNDRE